MITGWFTMEDWAAKHPSEVQRFRASIDQAARWAVANPEAAGQVLTKYFRYSVPRAHEYHARSLDPALLQPILDGAARYKVLSAPLDARELMWRS
jgi:ABC-type nitrate/sulfonate/bicarbonate transport system substrate-binding protein